MRVDRIEPQFVEFIPDVLQDGVLYISIPYGTIVHRCCCGCGEKVSTPLHPAQWRLTYDGETVSLTPSVGSGALPCRSHYFIARNVVRWAARMSKAETGVALQHDHEALADHYAPEPTLAPQRAGWLRRIRAWCGRRDR